MTSLASKLLLYLLFNDSCHSSQMTHVSFLSGSPRFFGFFGAR